MMNRIKIVSSRSRGKDHFKISAYDDKKTIAAIESLEETKMARGRNLTFINNKELKKF